MKKKNVFSLNVFFAILALSCFAVAGPIKSPFFRSIGTEQGLSHAKVNCILQDDRGFLWFGTEDGLNRYDGRFFTVFKNQPNDTSCISGNIITDLLEDKDGVLWIATADGGLTRYNYRLPASSQFKQYRYYTHAATGIPENRIRKFTDDGFGNLWLVTGKGILIRFHKRTGKFDLPVKTGQLGILSLAMSLKDTLWAGSAGGGLLKFNVRTLDTKSDPPGSGQYDNLLHAPISSVFKDKNNTMWYASWDRVLCARQSLTGKMTIRHFTGSMNVPKDIVCSITADKQMRIWMGTQNGGIAVYEPSDGRFRRFLHDEKAGSLADNHVNSVFTDRSGIVWIGTDNGISVYDPVYSPFQLINLPKAKNGNDIAIYDFYRDRDQRLWVGTSDGIYIKDSTGKKFEHRKIIYQGQALSVTKFFLDRDGAFYLGTNRTVFRYDRISNRVYPLPNTSSDDVMRKLVNSRIVSIVRDTINQHPVLMVSPYGHYLAYYDFSLRKWVSSAGIQRSVISKMDIRDNVIRKFYKDKTGGLWMATDKWGLGFWKKRTSSMAYYINNVSDRSSISSNEIFDVGEDGSGNLWISTYGGGLNYFDKKKHRFFHIPGSSNLTEGIQSDKEGNIWMICNGHLHAFKPSTGIYSCYDLPELAKNGGIRGYLYSDDYGNMYAAGVNFFVSFQPADVEKIESEPKVYFTDFKIFNSSYSQLLENRTIKLNHDENYFSIEFSAPEYSSNHMHYDYILVGIDKDWVDADRRNTASYSNLPSGKYLFKVRASNWKGSRVSKFTAITIVIKPPFWRKWWFFTLLFLFVAPICYLFYRYRVNEFLKRQSIRNGIAQDLHDHIGSTLSSISIYSKVAKIYQEQQKADKLKAVLQTIGTTADETIAEMSDIVWTINPKNDHMFSIVQKIESYAQPLCAAQNIHFAMDCDQRVLNLSLDMAVRKNFFLILKESINNAIKHSSCKVLTVAIRQSGNVIRLEVLDDGEGFDTNSNPAKVAAGTGGNGLANIRSRAAELNAQVVVESSREKGTSIKLTVHIP